MNPKVPDVPGATSAATTTAAQRRTLLRTLSLTYKQVFCSVSPRGQQWDFVRCRRRRRRRLLETDRQQTEALCATGCAVHVLEYAKTPRLYCAVSRARP